MSKPFGCETGATAINDENCGYWGGFCYLCVCANLIMNHYFEEVVDCCSDDGKIDACSYLERQKAMVQNAVNIIRPVFILASILGWFLLFSPVINILAFLPLVGTLLSTFVSLAALLFAIIVGITVASIVIALAWLVFRPIIGCVLLAASTLGILFIFFL